MSWLFNLSLQAFSPMSFRKRSKFYWATEAFSFFCEFFLFLLLPYELLVCLSFFTLRIFFIKNSLAQIIFKSFYLSVFLLKFQVDLINIIFLFSKPELKAVTFKNLLREIKDSLVQDIIQAHNEEDTIVYYFYRHVLKVDVRTSLFSALYKIVLSSDPVQTDLPLLKNSLHLLKAFKKNNPGLSNHEQSILTCLGLKLEHQSSLRDPEPSQSFFSKEHLLISALKELQISWHSFPALGLKSNPCKEFIAEVYPVAYLSIKERRLKQLISLILFFNKSTNLEETYSLLYKHKKRMFHYWTNFFSSNPNNADILAWFNFHILITKWNLNYDELLTIHQGQQVPPVFNINIKREHELTSLDKMITYLKAHYTDKRIIKLLLADGGTQDFNDCLLAGHAYFESSYRVAPPKKPRTFRDLKDFFQIHGIFKEKCLELLPQKHLDHIYGLAFEGFILKIPRTRKDLIVAGTKLSICVGTSDLYTLKVKLKQSYIIFLYKDEEPRYCLEICPHNLEIKQAKGTHNHQLDEETILKLHCFLKEHLVVQAKTFIPV